MVDNEHLRILKRGADVWNAWRDANLITRPNLKRARLKAANLKGADLDVADLKGAILEDADLSEASLEGANLSGAYLVGASIEGAKLTGAHVAATNFGGAKLNGADLKGAKCYETIFSDIDLSIAEGLEHCTHWGPSCVDYRTLVKSKNVPLVFWRGCGLPDSLIEYMPSLTSEAIQFYSCFISYSSNDEQFARRLHADLQDKGVRCWFAPHDMRTGDRIRDTIDEQIRLHEKLLLILSENSVSSNWVENEVEAAMDKEEDRKSVLFPVRIDEAAEDSDVAWARTIRRTRHIRDFSGWKDHDAYQEVFQRLLSDLEVER